MGVCGCVIPNPNCHCHSKQVMDTETSRVAKLLADQAKEIERLRQQNAELLAALKDMSGAGYAIVSIYRAAISKATGGE